MKEEVLSLANPKYNRKTSEERKQEIQAISQKALQQIEKYTKSVEDVLEYADFMSRFYSYSANNLALIQQQFEGAQAVSSYKDWKDKGYSVQKGEKGIQILSYAPVTLFKDANGEMKQLSQATQQEKQFIKDGQIPIRKIANFKVGHVFDISQTNAPIEDLPKIFPNKQFNFQIEEGSNAVHLRKGIKAVAKELNIEIKDMRQSELGLTELGVSKGAFVQGKEGNEIVMNSRNTETQVLATSIHELAHAKLHIKGGEFDNMERATKEFQAELTSYIVCKHFGMDTSEKAVPYIATWTQNGENIENKQKALEGVNKTAKEFIEIMDDVISEEQQLEMKNVQEEQIQETKSEKKEELLSITDQELKSIHLDGPIMYIEGDSKNYRPFGEMNSYVAEFHHKDYITYTVSYPKDKEIKSFSGKYCFDEYNHPLHHIYDNNLLNQDTLKDFQADWLDHLGREDFDQWRKQEIEMIKHEETKKLYPIDWDQAIYCELTGKAIPEDDFYYKTNDGKVLSEQAKMLMFTNEEWEQSTENGNYQTINFYSFHFMDREMTRREPEPRIDNKNEYYFYDGQSKPVKLGTVSDIVSSAQNQESIDHFSFDKEFIRDLAFSKNEIKEEFNEKMVQHNVLKNPKLKDFQKVNERLGQERDQNLLDIKNKAGRKVELNFLRNMGMQR